jgi:hypothetical protein
MRYKHLLAVLIVCIISFCATYALKDDLLNQAFKQSLLYNYQIDLRWARSATSVWTEVFKSSIWIQLNIENIGNDPKVCAVNGKPIQTDLSKEICNKQYSGTFTDDFMCFKNWLNIPVVATSCLTTDPSYNSSTCEIQRQSDCASKGGQYIPPPNGICYKSTIVQWEVPVDGVTNEEDCLNPSWLASLSSSARRRSQPSHCVMSDGTIKIISDIDKDNSCKALWWTFEEPGIFDVTKKDPLLIRIIKFFIRMTVLLWVSAFIYVWIRYILSSSSWWDLYNSAEIRLLIQIWVWIIIVLMSLAILYLILSITGSGSEVVQDLSG